MHQICDSRYDVLAAVENAPTERWAISLAMAKGCSSMDVEARLKTGLLAGLSYSTFMDTGASEMRRGERIAYRERCALMLRKLRSGGLDAYLNELD